MTRRGMDDSERLEGPAFDVPAGLRLGPRVPSPARALALLDGAEELAPSGAAVAWMAEAVAQRLDASRRRAALDSLASGLGHHVLNPLAGISADAETIPELVNALWTRLGPQGPQVTSLLEELRAVAEGVSGAALRISSAIRELRTLAAAPAALQLVPVGLRQAVEDALGRLVQREGIQVELDIPAVLEVRADLVGLRLAIEQVLENAFEAVQGHSGAGHIWIDVHQGPGVPCVLTISDDGPGVPDEIEALVFEPFFSANRSPDRRGIGLALTRMLVEGMGGRVSYEPRLGGGAAFCLVLAPVSP